MHIAIHPQALDDAAKNQVDLIAFCDLFAPESPQWDQLAVSSSWGMLLFCFHSPESLAIVPVNLDVFLLTKGTVVSNDGQIVSRWQRVAQEILHWADSHAQPRRVLAVAQ
jgi:hypothetical protein